VGTTCNNAEMPGRRGKEVTFLEWKAKEDAFSLGS
jgi:hypothetical protein